MYDWQKETNWRKMRYHLPMEAVAKQQPLNSSIPKIGVSLHLAQQEAKWKREAQLRAKWNPELRRSFSPIFDRQAMKAKSARDVAHYRGHPLYDEFIRRKTQFDEALRPLHEYQFHDRWKQSNWAKLPEWLGNVLAGWIFGRGTGTLLGGDKLAKILSTLGAMGGIGLSIADHMQTVDPQVIWEYSWEQFSFQKRVEAQLLDGPSDFDYNHGNWYRLFDPRISDEEKQLHPFLWLPTPIESWYHTQLLDWEILYEWDRRGRSPQFLDQLMEDKLFASFKEYEDSFERFQKRLHDMQLEETHNLWEVENEFWKEEDAFNEAYERDIIAPWLDTKGLVILVEWMEKLYCNMEDLDAPSRFKISRKLYDLLNQEYVDRADEEGEIMEKLDKYLKWRDRVEELKQKVKAMKAEDEERTRIGNARVEQDLEELKRRRSVPEGWGPRTHKVIEHEKSLDQGYAKGLFR